MHGGKTWEWGAVTESITIIQEVIKKEHHELGREVRRGGIR